MTQDATALLPCPFCGPGQSMVDPWFDDVSKRWAIGCGRCGSSSGRSVYAEGSKEAAIKSWNTRATSQTPDAVRKAAEEVCAFDYADSCVELQHDIEALRTALSTPSASAGPQAEAVGSSWQDISTAPKDGTRILVCRADRFPKNTYVARWLEDAWSIGVVGGEWHAHPTHWMKLPTGPFGDRMISRTSPPAHPQPQQADGRGAAIGPYKGPMTVDASLLHALWCYSILNPVAGVLYSYGTHQKALDDVDKLLYDRAALQQSPATDNAPETK